MERHRRPSTSLADDRTKHHDPAAVVSLHPALNVAVSTAQREE